MEYWLSIRTLIYISLFILGIYWYHRYRDKFIKWGVVIVSIIFLNRTISHYEYLFNLTPKWQHITSIVHLIISIVLFVSLIVVGYIFRNRRTTFKKDTNLKGFNRELKGKPELISINPKFKDFAGKDKFPYLLVIHLEMLKKDSTGLPKGKIEIKELDETEDSLVSELGKVCEHYFIGRTTYNGFRYLWYYTDNDAQIKEAFHKMSDGKGRKFYTFIEKDPAWEKAQRYFNIK